MTGMVAMHRELLLLGLLRKGDMHGYGLNDFIEQYLALCADLKKPTAYALLNRMEEQGWVERHAEQVGKRPPRHIYRLTAVGEAQFQALLRENLAAYHPVRFSADIGLAFADALSAEEVV